MIYNLGKIISVILKVNLQFSRLMLHSLYLTYLRAFKVTLLISRANSAQMCPHLHTNAKDTPKSAPNFESSTLNPHINYGRFSMEGGEWEY